MYTSSGQFVWQNSLQGISQSSFGNCSVASLAIDKTLGVVATGAFYGTVDFSPASSYDTLRAYQASIGTCYLAKYDSTGTYIFAKRLDNHTGSALGYIAIDQFDNVILAGYFNGIVDFDLSIGVALDTASNFGTNDCFISKYDPQGNYLWHGRFGSNDNSSIANVATDANGGILVGGSLRGILDADMGPGVFNLGVNGNCSGCEDGFVAKYSATGQLLLGFSFSAFANDLVMSVACYQDRFTSTGMYSGLMDFDPSADTMIIPAMTLNGYNYFHVQYFDSTFVSGINSSTTNEHVYIYPNPSSDFIRIKSAAMFESYELVNISGQTIQKGASTQIIDVRNLACGVYFLLLSNEKGDVSRTKFVRE